MKKVLVFLLTVSMTFLAVHAETIDLATHCEAAILIEASSKEIIFEKNMKEKMYPASTTKIMSMILLFEALNAGKIHFEDMVTTSSYAASMGGSQVYLEENEQMSVKDLFHCIAIGSANDATVAIGEFIAGTNDAFVEMMNQKAKELNLVNTHFKNATGLHDDENYSCAYDLAMMASYLIEIGQDTLLEVTSTIEDYVRVDSDSKFWLVNTNKLLNSYAGLDGLKTGYTKDAGYCLVGTAKREGIRMIAVGLKAPTPKERNQDVAQMLDYGFNHYESHTIYKQGDLITNMVVFDSPITETGLYAKEDIYSIVQKGEANEPSYNINIVQNQAPIQANDTVAYLELMQRNGKIKNYELVVNEYIPKLKFIEKVLRDFQNMWQ